MTSQEACSMLGVEASTLYKYVKDGKIRRRPLRQGSRYYTYHKDDVMKVLRERTGPWTIPYLLVEEGMTHGEVDDLINRIKFFCFSQKYWPLREPSVDVIRESKFLTGFKAMYKFRQILDWATEHKLERLVLPDPLLFHSNTVTYQALEYLLAQLGVTEIVVADLNMR